LRPRHCAKDREKSQNNAEAEEPFLRLDTELLQARQLSLWAKAQTRRSSVRRVQRNGERFEGQYRAGQRSVKRENVMARATQGDIMTAAGIEDTKRSCSCARSHLLLFF
jgi:hypothetical protein